MHDLHTVTHANKKGGVVLGKRTNYHSAKAPESDYDWIGAIVAYERGELGDDNTATLFQYLVDTDLFDGLGDKLKKVGHDLINAKIIHALNEFEPLEM